MTEKQFSRRFQQIAVRFRQLINRTDTARIEQLRYDFGSYLLEAAGALESATNAKLVSRWDSLRTVILATAHRAFPGASILVNGVSVKLKSTPRYFEVLRGQKADRDRLCLLWTFCVGSYLAKEHPLRFPADAGERDWSHSRRDLSVPPFIEYFSDEEAAKLGVPLRTSVANEDKCVIKSWTVPEQGIVKDESALGELVGDEADERHRFRLRAEVYETACEVLAELIERPCDMPEVILGPRTSTDRHEWNPRPGYVGRKAICTHERFKKQGKNPSATTIDGWVKSAKSHGALIQIEKDPANHENYYAEEWIMERIGTWNPRKPKT
ncbi:MAG: hypothetical protein AABZ47_00010 [Planctomycetota bacterium]